MAGRILIVDNVATNRMVLKVKLAAACYQPFLAEDDDSCLQLARDGRADFILINMMTATRRAEALLTALRRDPRSRTIPVIVLAAEASPEARMAVLRAGADDVLARPIEDAVLLARIRSLLRLSEALAELGQGSETLRDLGLSETRGDFQQAGVIALVSDQPDFAQDWAAALAHQSADRFQLLTREQALAEAAPDAVAADIFVIDAESGGPGGGRRLMAELRSRTPSRHAGIVLLHRAPDAEDIALAYDMGANEALADSLPPAELAIRLRSLLRRKQTADRIRRSVQHGLRLAVIDPLTGLYNRRFALPRLAAMADRAQAMGSGFAVMIVDLDQFKTVNDSMGHPAGDAVLVEVSQRLADNLRLSDLVARIGGDEFLVALPDCGLADAQATAARLCRMVRDQPIRLPDGRDLAITVSIGLAMAPQDDRPIGEIAEIVGRADRALLAAKAAGRNRVILGATAA